MKKKLTPEQIAAENKARQERADNEIRDRQEHRIKTREAAAANLQKLRDNAIAMVSVGGVKASIGNKWLEIQDAIEAGTENILANPAYWFEWSSSMMELAAKRDILDQIIWAHIQQNGENLLDILKGLKDQITRQLLQNTYSCSSTSATSNAMSMAHVSARSRMLGFELPMWIAELEESK